MATFGRCRHADLSSAQECPLCASDPHPNEGTAPPVRAEPTSGKPKQGPVRSGFLWKAFIVIFGGAFLFENGAVLLIRGTTNPEPAELAQFDREVVVPWRIAIKRGKVRMQELSSTIAPGPDATQQLANAMRTEIIPPIRMATERLKAFPARSSSVIHARTVLSRTAAKMLEAFEGMATAIEAGDSAAVEAIQLKLVNDMLNAADPTLPTRSP